jgi:hypothetical protein
VFDQSAAVEHNDVGGEPAGCRQIAFIHSATVWAETSTSEHSTRRIAGNIATAWAGGSFIPEEF